MPAFLAPPPYLEFRDNSGVPLAGGFVYTYLAGTTTPAAVYSDSTGTTPLSNPVPLDSAGRTTIWGNGSYKFVVTSADGGFTKTTDNINIPNPIASISGAVITDANLTSGPPIRRQNNIRFTATNNYTPSANLVGILVRMIASGGGGGGCGATANLVAGGGASGSYVEKYLTAAQVNALLSGGVIAYSQGSLGAGGVGNAAGGNATTSAFAGLTALGGGGGSAGGSLGIPGNPNSASGGDFDIPGISGNAAYQAGGIGSPGGNTPMGYGGGGYGGTYGGNGAGGNGYGSGGGGASTGASATARNGGPGQPGVLYITEYLSV